MADNSHRHELYHCRTCRLDNITEQPGHQTDTAMYAFNEIGLTQYIDSMDEQRGTEDKNSEELNAVLAFMQHERLS